MNSYIEMLRFWPQFSKLLKVREKNIVQVLHIIFDIRIEIITLTNQYLDKH